MSGLISVICLRYSLDFDSFREHRRLVGWYWEILVTWRTNSQQVFLGNDEIHSSLGIIIHPLRQPKEPLAVACFGDGAQNRAWQPTDAWQKWSSMNESIPMKDYGSMFDTRTIPAVGWNPSPAWNKTHPKWWAYTKTLRFVGDVCFASWIFVGLSWLQPPVAVCWRRSHCKFSGLTWFDIVFFFTGPCRSIESQQDCEEHGIVMESDWQWRSRGLVAFGLFAFRYVKANFS